MTAEPIHVVFCAGHGYFQHLAAAAISLAATTPDRNLRLHVLSCDDDRLADERLHSSLQGFGNVSLTLHRIDARQLGPVFVDRYLSRETYLRFLAPEVLPPEASRAIYLDSDLVVRDHVGALWATDLDGAAVAAAADIGWLGPVADERRAALQIPPGYPYFNAGVLVLDLDLWRRENLGGRLLAFAAERGATLAFHDQDALNLVLRGRIRRLDPRWNVQALMYSRWFRRTYPEDHALSRQARSHPGIIHYASQHKPWDVWSPCKRKAAYFACVDRSAWRDLVPETLGPLERRQYGVARRLLRWGIDPHRMLALTARPGRDVAVPGTAHPC